MEVLDIALLVVLVVLVEEVRVVIVLVKAKMQPLILEEGVEGEE